jgi:hypothetical protein
MLQANPGVENAASVLRRLFENGAAIEPSLTTGAIGDEIRLYGIKSLHKKLPELENNGKFPCVDKNFRVIDADTRIAVVDGALAQKIRCGKPGWQELQLGSVQIALHKLEKLRIPRLTNEIYHWTLGYNSFIGYMAGIIEAQKLVSEPIFG